MRYWVLGLIWFYQRFLSPVKGYRCAYSVAHGGTGCSGYAKGRIREQGVVAALPAIRARFTACRAAAQNLHTRQNEDKKKDGNRRRSERRECARDCCTNGPDAHCCTLPWVFGRTGSGATSGKSAGCDACDACDGFGP